MKEGFAAEDLFNAQEKILMVLPLYLVALGLAHLFDELMQRIERGGMF